MAMKAFAALLTGSVGLLSDALESSVNLVAAIGALVALRAIARDPDDEYAYGRAKAEYLSAGVEGTLIVIAAIVIMIFAVPRLWNPSSLEDIGIGLAVSIGAALVNLVVGLRLRRAGQTHDSITLEADGAHLLTDVWTSAGVLVGILAVAATGWKILDPIIAIGVAANIVFSGYTLIRRSVRGLLDASLPIEQRQAIDAVLEQHRSFDLEFHAVRTRQAGRRSYMSMHVLVPGQQTVTEAHDRVEQIEANLRAAVPRLNITAHIEPLEDPRSYADEDLDRRATPPSVARVDDR